MPSVYKKAPPNNFGNDTIKVAPSYWISFFSEVTLAYILAKHTYTHTHTSFSDSYGYLLWIEQMGKWEWAYR